MNTPEILQLIFGFLATIVGAGGLKGWIDRKKYLQEIEKLKAEIKAAHTNTRGDELDNVKKAMDILMEQVVEPLKVEINGIRKEMARFRKAVDKANGCPFSPDCPVRMELQSAERADPDQHVRQPANKKRIRADPRPGTDEPGETGDSDAEADGTPGGHGL